MIVSSLRNININASHEDLWRNQIKRKERSTQYTSFYVGSRRFLLCFLIWPSTPTRVVMINTQNFNYACKCYTLKCPWKIFHMWIRYTLVAKCMTPPWSTFKKIIFVLEFWNSHWDYGRCEHGTLDACMVMAPLY